MRIQRYKRTLALAREVVTDLGGAISHVELLPDYGLPAVLGADMLYCSAPVYGIRK